MGRRAESTAIVVGLLVAGCGAPRVASVPLRSATISTPLVLSCHGEGLCREDILLAGPRRADAVDDAIADCTRRGGTSSRTACPRSAAMGWCSLASEAGSITVFSYTGDALSEMSSRCDDFGGSFTLAKE